MSVPATALAPPLAPGLSPARAERIYSLMDKVDYRVAVTDEDRDAIFRLRYNAYLKEKAILPNFSKRFVDRYDEADNTATYGLWIEDQLAMTIRLSVVSADYPECPSMESFSDYLEPELKAGKVLIDPTRHSADEGLSRKYPGLLPYLSTRIPWMAAEYYNADIILGTVRIEHQAFYRKVFNFEPVCDPRDYLSLIKPLSLMYCDFPLQRDQVHLRYPTFRSTRFERRALFGEAPGLAAPARIVPPVEVEQVSSAVA